METIVQQFSFKRLYFFMITLLMTIAIGQPLSIHASKGNTNHDSGLHVTAKAGYNDQYKDRTITPVFITLTNESEKTITGDFVINIATSEGITVSHITAVEINAGNEISFVVEVEGKLVQQYNEFHFFEGGIEKGKEISFTGQQYAAAEMFTNENMIGIVANDPDTLNFLVFLNAYGFQIKTSVLSEDFEVPSTDALQMFDIIVINDIATSSWSSDKVTNIKRWVQNGGSLVLSGGASYSKTMEAFKDIAPVTMSGTTLLEQTEPISQYASNEQHSLGPITISNGQVVQGHSVLEIADQPIIATYSYGKGNVHYIAFDPALEPFSTWKDASGFMGNMLNNELVVKGFKYNEKFDNTWALRDAASFFPQLKSPNLGLLLFIIACYIVIVAPVMYIVLKKLDKREYAWWTIPTVAIITVMLVVFLGSADKNQYHVHSVKTIEINDGIQSSQGVVSVFLANNDQLTMEVPLEQSITFLSHNMSGIGKLTENYEYKHYAEQNMQKLAWNDNNYWSTRTFRINQSSESVNEQKTIETTVVEKEGNLYLKVKNSTGEQLEHIALINGAVLYRLGTLDNNEELEYELPPSLQMTIGMSGYVDYANQLFNNTNQTSGDYQREAAFLQGGRFMDDRISLIAFSYGNHSDYQLNKKKYKQDTLTFWSKSLVHVIQQFKTNEHYYEATLDLFEPGQIEMYSSNEFYLNIGEVELLFTIPSKEQLVAATFKLVPATFLNSDLTAEIYNVKEEQWELYDDEQLLLADYLDESGKVRLKLSTKTGASSVMPTLMLESGGQQ